LPSSRFQIEADLVRKLIAAQFPGWADLPLEQVTPGGHDNRTFRLGDTMLVRLPSHPDYAAAVEKEQRWLPVLAPHLPVPIPEPLGLGLPTADFPCKWSIYRWLEGEVASHARLGHNVSFAVDLARFLKALQAISSTSGPTAGQHSFHRGGDLHVYDAQTCAAITTLGGAIDGGAARQAWNAALRADWQGHPVWVHGDIAANNLLTSDDHLSGVIDFGSCAVGDPACDLVIAWTMFEAEARAAFRDHLALDAKTWARARGWALWKTLITLADTDARDPPGMVPSSLVLARILDEHEKTL
jgi:aminoglycoside phosphotransferase (APT) family kinase protein